MDPACVRLVKLRTIVLKLEPDLNLERFGTNCEKNRIELKI